MLQNTKKIQISRLFRFDAGHRVLGHESKCQTIHGHGYTVKVTVTAPVLDSLGRVVDFSCLKKEIGQWIDTNWDHTFIAHPDDPILKMQSELQNRKPFFIMPRDTANPTAENMATFLKQKATELLEPYSITVVSVEIWETPNCMAEAF